MRWQATVSFALAGIAGCAGPQDGSEPTAPVFAAARVDQTPRARLHYADAVNVGTVLEPVWVPAGYRGDGRLRDGTPGGQALSNEYQGDWCGVNATIGTGSQGQMSSSTFDPNQWWTSSLPPSCHPARAVQIYLDGPSAAPRVTQQHQYFPGLGSMAIGDSLVIPWNNGTAAEFGVNLWFNDAYPPASSPRWIRLPNIIDEFGRSVRTWRIESRGSHRAMGAAQVCSGKKCSLGPDGDHVLPALRPHDHRGPVPIPDVPLTSMDRAIRSTQSLQQSRPPKERERTWARTSGFHFLRSFRRAACRSLGDAPQQHPANGRLPALPLRMGDRVAEMRTSFLPRPWLRSRMHQGLLTGPCRRSSRCASGLRGARRLITVSAGTGGKTVTIDKAAGMYRVNWDTKVCETGPCTLDAAKTYRLRVTSRTPSSGLRTLPGFERLGPQEHFQRGIHRRG